MTPLHHLVLELSFKSDQLIFPIKYFLRSTYKDLKNKPTTKMRKPTSSHKWFTRITLTPGQEETKVDLVGNLFKDLTVEDGFVVYEVGSKTEKPHLHLIFTCLGSKEHVAKAIKKIFSILPNTGMYSMKEYDEKFDAYAYCCKGSSSENLPVVVCDQVGRMVQSMHQKYWSVSHSIKLCGKTRKLRAKARAGNLKADFLEAVAEQKLETKRDMVKLLIAMHKQLLHPICLFYCEKLVRLAYSLSSEFATESVEDDLCRRLDK